MTTHTSGAADLPEALSPVHELQAIVAEFKHGLPFDKTSCDTIERVIAALAAGKAVAPAIDASPSAASIAWNALRDVTDPLGELGARIMGHVRIFAQRQYEAGRDEARLAPPAMDGGDAEDAKRYRWLRDQVEPREPYGDFIFPFVCGVDFRPWAQPNESFDNVDDAIDAARAAQKEE